MAVTKTIVCTLLAKLVIRIELNVFFGKEHDDDNDHICTLSAKSVTIIK